jgi:hypothetical protein
MVDRLMMFNTSQRAPGHTKAAKAIAAQIAACVYDRRFPSTPEHNL